MPRSRSRRSRKVAAAPPPALGSAIRAFQSGDFDQAARLCERVLAADPDNGETLNLLGGIRSMRGDPAGATEAFARALKASPGNADIRANFGSALATAGRFAEAEVHFSQALAQNPQDGATRANLARTQHALGRHGEALENFAAVLAHDPNDVDTLLGAGCAAFAGGDVEQAEQFLRRGLAVAPHRVDLVKELVRVLHASGRHKEGLACIDMALASNAGDAEFHADRGLVLLHLDRYDEALASFDRASECDPDSADAVFGRSLAHLLLGRFGAGWEEYRARESMRSAAARNSLAAAGEGFHRELLPADLSGRKVLVVGDQGLGDELFFLRFVGRLRERGAFVAYCPDPRLAAMLWRAGVADEIAQGEPAAGAHDYRVSAGDLPWLTGFADEDPLPPSIVLSPHPKHLVDVRDRLARFGAGPYIGVTWRAGSAGARRLLFKEAPAHELADMLAGVQGSVVIVQRAPAEGEVEAFAHALGRPVLDLSALNADLEATLALCGLLDAYVAVSNTNVHLRAACGMTSNVLVPFPPEFRWMATGDESPWFAGTPLYRQQPDASWEKAFSDLACDLKSVRPLLEAAG